ncbi:MAG: LexA family transcriptional regulator [Bacteroidetes bacterium]|nr:LexA family transcriptional regulator [Bacteroidota bacterium]MCB0844229.1 LexA family transcriptional regulator [Bacteroidota bacterium]MCB0852745.1 LexA family transcriptional regulator [Bacteroidota bacterium]
MSEKDKLIIGKNLKYLRKLKGLTQQELANHLGIRRSSIGAYEECRATPKYETLEKISDFFQVSIDLLVKEDVSQYSEDELQNHPGGAVDLEGKALRVLPITIDSEGRENIEFVQQRASAGYLNGFADPEYIEDLPKFQLPMLGSGTFRAFEIKGDSMLPMKSGTVIIGEYLQNWRDIKNGQTYIIVSETEGVVYKRVYTKILPDGTPVLTLRSDNTAYAAYDVSMEDVKEIWKSRMFMSDDFPDPEMSMEKLTSIVMDIQQEMIRLKNQN